MRKPNLKPIKYSQLAKADYNRKIQRKKVDRILSEFNEKEIRPVVVSWRSGKYYIIDGQHTALAIYEKSGNDKDVVIWCDVYENLSYTEEARLFVKMNTNGTTANKNEAIHGNLCGEDPDAIEFQRIVLNSGLHIGAGANGIRTPSVPYGIFEKDKANGTNNLSHVLRLIAQTWPDSTVATQSVIIKGLNILVSNHSKTLIDSRFTDRLTGIPIKALKNEAKSKAAEVRENTNHAMYRVFCKYYNGGPKTKGFIKIIPIDS